MKPGRSCFFFSWVAVVIAASTFLIGGCAPVHPPLPPSAKPGGDYYYRIGTGDSVQVFVWGNPEVSATVPVGPDGRITTPLVEDLPASGKTASELARGIERALSKYIRNPLVTVIVDRFEGGGHDQVRAVGEVARPKALPYRADMTLLDLMISVGGVTDSAAGNRACVVRNVDGQQQQFGVRIDDLLENADISANVQLLPGDIVMIPKALF